MVEGNKRPYSLRKFRSTVDKNQRYFIFFYLELLCMFAILQQLQFLFYPLLVFGCREGVAKKAECY